LMYFRSNDISQAIKISVASLFPDLRDNDVCEKHPF